MGADLPSVDLDGVGRHVDSVFADRSSGNFYRRWLEMLTGKAEAA
jgi:hypothetical protein